MKPKAVKYLSAISLNGRIQFLKILFRWKGSVWKLLWADFVWFFLAYIGVTLLYRLYLVHDPFHKRNFDTIVSYMNKVSALVPLSFLLGFFVSTVLGRWWAVVTTIPWMTKPALTCQASITGDDLQKCKDLRITLIRYLNIAWIMAIMDLSQKIKDRFNSSTKAVINKFWLKNAKFKKKTIRQKVEEINSDPVVVKYFGKLIMEEEITVFENYENESGKPSYLIPLMWSTKLLQRALKSGYLKSESTCSNLIGMVQTLGSSLESLGIYNQFNVPLVYTQVIIIVVYLFLFSEILSQQTISIDNRNNIDAYFPIFAIFKFIIYMGWFKVGLCFINPFGNDEGDLPFDQILDYNLEVSASISLAEDKYFPEYLSESLNDSGDDPFGIFKKFRSILPTREIPMGEKTAKTDFLEMQKISGSC